MNPIELIKRDLDVKESDASPTISEVPDQCPFVRHRLFVAYGATGLFDFATLPGGSMAYYAANGETAIRMTRADKEVESILSAEWDNLPAADPVLLASLILKFYDSGIRSTHDVLRDANSLLKYGCPENANRSYELNETQFSKALSQIGVTESTKDGDTLSIRAVTLCGRMHNKQNLGVESFTIRRDGRPTFGKRHVLSKKIFRRVPAIRY